MSALRAFTEQSREAIVRSGINNSKSKNLWTFSKQKRFQESKPNCPYVAYDKNLSTISNLRTQFGNSRRKVFTEVSENPTSWNYNPSGKKLSQAISFGESREKCLSNCYLPLSIVGNPGPGRYEGDIYSKKKGYTMRPKTANQRNYFIDDKEQADKPSPFEYQVDTGRIAGKGTVSKFKTLMLGSSGLQTKNERFRQFAYKTPSPGLYNPQNYKRSKSKGGKIGEGNRKSFVDSAANNSFAPGPGNYQLPSEFGHYKRIASSLPH